MIGWETLKDPSKRGFKKNHVHIPTNKLYKLSKPRSTTSFLQVPLLLTLVESLKLQEIEEVVEEEDMVAGAMGDEDPAERPRKLWEPKN